MRFFVSVKESWNDMQQEMTIHRKNISRTVYQKGKLSIEKVVLTESCSKKYPWINQLVSGQRIKIIDTSRGSSSILYVTLRKIEITESRTVHLYFANKNIKKKN